MKQFVVPFLSIAIFSGGISILHYHSQGEVLGVANDIDSTDSDASFFYLKATGVEDGKNPIGDTVDLCGEQVSLEDCNRDFATEIYREPAPIYPAWVERGFSRPDVPKPRVTIPRVWGEYPKIFKKDSAGRLVCNKRNDHPGKSKQNKKTHMDMECCLDPDEIPNPHCHYPVEKYGKYLNKSHK